MHSARRLPRFVARSLAVIPLAFAAPFAGAQCPSWVDGFYGTGATVDVHTLRVVDAGSGPLLYMMGRFQRVHGTPASYMARFDGTQWHAMNVPWTYVNDVAAYDSGTGPDLYIAGYLSVSAVRRWNGSTWDAVHFGLDGGATSLCVFDDGSGSQLYAGGWVRPISGAPFTAVMRYDGQGWTAVGAGPDDAVNALCAFDDGSGPALYAAGRFTSIASGTAAARIARWNGSSWAPVGSGFDGEVWRLDVADIGSGPRLLAGGKFLNAGGVPAARIAQWDGTTWSGIGGGTDGDVFSLASFDDGTGHGTRLYAGGTFTSAGGVAASGIAAWDGVAWSALAEGVHSSVNPAVYALAPFVRDGQPRLFAGGWFAASGTTITRSIGLWNGATWESFRGGGCDLGPYAMTMWNDGSGPMVYASGAFWEGGYPTSLWALRRLTPNGWETVAPDLNGYAQVATSFDDGSGSALYLGGSFTLGGSTIVRRLARWNGTSWSEVGGGLNNTVNALSYMDLGGGPALYVGGAFTQAGTTVVNRVARWDGAQWTTFGIGANAPVRSLCAVDLGSGPRLAVGGAFTQIGGLPSAGVSIWNGATWLDLAGGVNGYGNSLVAFDDGSGPALYVGGQFTTAGGAPALRVARWNGSTWSALGAGFNGTVTRLCVFDDGSGPALYAGGQFTQSGTTPAKSLARWTGSTWVEVAGGLSVKATLEPSLPGGTPVVYDMFAARDDSGAPARLWISGDFWRAGSQNSNGIAALEACAAAITAFCAGDGSGMMCPCGNSGSVGHGCAHSVSANGALLQGSGVPALDTLALLGTDMPSSSTAIYLQGDATTHTTFGDGVRCVDGHLVRLRSVPSSSGSSSLPTAGGASISVLGGVTPGSGAVRAYQTYYRNAAPTYCTPATFNVTNAVRVVW